MRPPLSDRPAWQRYGFALGLIVAALLGRKLLDPYTTDAASLAPMYAAVTLAVWFGGWRPAIFVMVAGYLAALSWSYPPRLSLELWGESGAVRTLIYVISGGTIIFLCESMRRARRRHAASEQRLEDEVARRTIELRQTIADLESFSYILVHDMRAPLRSIRHLAELLKDEHRAEFSPAVVEHLGRIENTADRMDRLILDVLRYSRLTRIEAELHDVDLNEVVRDVISSRAFPSDQAEIQVAEGLPTVRANQALLGQCLGNLLQNATKFVAPGVKPRIRIYADGMGGSVRLNVADNGIGILPEAKERIFEPFQREDARYEGTGIGLAIVRKVIERLHGHVGVESEPGVGSRFWLELPAAASAQPRAVDGARVNATPAPTAR